MEAYQIQMVKKTYLSFLLIMFLTACSAADFSSAPQEQPGKEYCGAACDNLIKLGCDLGKPITDDGSVIDCYERCDKEHKEGYFWNAYCLMDIDACYKIDSYCKPIYKKHY